MRESQASEAIAMCSDGAAEGAALGHSFGALLALRVQLIVRQANYWPMRPNHFVLSLR